MNALKCNARKCTAEAEIPSKCMGIETPAYYSGVKFVKEKVVMGTTICAHYSGNEVEVVGLQKVVYY